ncbi:MULTISPECIES: hypothetical protein [Paraburkholderia]|jgi:hypothetical protein|uniref:hypothetical protein n=1 Tax=Paraburkholderia TaxID=1822464 RepID=UPI0038BB14D7
MAEVSEASTDEDASLAPAGAEGSTHPTHLPPVLVPSEVGGEPDEDAPPVVAEFRRPPAGQARKPLPDIANPPAIPANSPNEDEPPASGSDAPRKDDNNVLLIEQEVENHKANRELRNKYAGKAYDLACGGLVFWGVALSATGIVFVLTGRQMLSDKVLIAITTGATVNVLAAFLGVIRGLFPNASGAPKEKSEKKAPKEE